MRLGHAASTVDRDATSHGKAITQFQLVLGRVEDFPQIRPVAGHKFLAIRQRDLEHAQAPFSRTDS
jgi:hypothetical protein